MATAQDTGHHTKTAEKAENDLQGSHETEQNVQMQLVDEDLFKVEN